MTEEKCRGCGKVLLPENFGMVADGCPCNSPRGVNHGLVPKDTCTCHECDPAQTGSVRTMARIKFIDAFPWSLRPSDSSYWLVVDRHGVMIASFPEKVIAEYVVTLANNDNRATFTNKVRAG